MIDAYLLRLAGVSMELLRPKDFASDLLPLRLFSLDTIEKLNDLDDQLGSTSSEDKAVVAATLFFIRLRLHAVNAPGVPGRHRALFIYCSMVWLTSIKGAAIVTKRNIVAETLSFVFTVLCSDMPNPRYATSEPCEHTFGNYRLNTREFTTLEFAQLNERYDRRLTHIFQNNFRPSRDPGHGYQATFDNFISYAMRDDTNVDDGTVDIDPSGDCVAVQLWDVASTIISFGSSLMTEMLVKLGVSSDDLSPFCREFATLVELRDAFIAYLPSTYTFHEVRGEGPDEDCTDDVDNTDDVDDEERLAARVAEFAKEMSAPPKDEKDGAEDDESFVVDLDETKEAGASR